MIAYVDAQELEHFFESRGAKGDCPACGYGGAWARIEDDKQVGLQLEGGGIMRAIGVICSNCGLMRLHSSDFIEGALGDPRVGLTE